MDHSPRIVCVYKSGGDFTPRYVRVLSQSVYEHTGMRLTCLSDDPSVERYSDYVPMAHNWPKWWGKLELFSNFRHALYLDLDVIVKADVSHLLDCPVDTFTMCRSFKGTGRANSSVMRWRGDYSDIPQAFNTDMIPEYSNRHGWWGDQDFIYNHLGRDPEFFDDGIVASRKRNCVMTRKAAQLLCYHGKPRPHETGWAKI